MYHIIDISHFRRGGIVKDIYEPNLVEDIKKDETARSMMLEY